MKDQTHFSETEPTRDATANDPQIDYTLATAEELRQLDAAYQLAHALRERTAAKRAKRV